MDGDAVLGVDVDVVAEDAAAVPLQGEVVVVVVVVADVIGDDALVGAGGEAVHAGDEVGVVGGGECADEHEARVEEVAVARALQVGALGERRHEVVRARARREHAEEARLHDHQVRVEVYELPHLPEQPLHQRQLLTVVPVPRRRRAVRRVERDAPAHRAVPVLRVVRDHRHARRRLRRQYAIVLHAVRVGVLREVKREYRGQPHVQLLVM